MKCTRCDWNYPDHVLISPLVGSLHRGEVCGICAREMRKAILGGDVPFREGSYAAQAEQDALEYRKTNPRKAPRRTE